jgi:YNFM family putative membrane transporter
MRPQWLVILATMLTISALYVPQPLLPVLAVEFAVSRETAALLTTVVFIPLSLAPLLYGFLLEAVSARRVLRLALLLLGLSTLAMVFVDSYAWLLFWRLVQGLLIPALLTALMTYTSQSVTQGDVQRAMAWYIGATISGGFAGRALSGVVASLFDWRISFFVLAVSLLLSWLALVKLPESGELKVSRPRLGLLREILAEPVFLRCYLMVFCFFLVFAAIMNFLPFRLAELTEQADELRIGLAYSGYLMGLVASLNAIRLQRWFGSVERTMLVALLFFLLALGLLALPSVALLLATLFLFCGAMFLAHASASGLLNHLAAEHKGMVNGLYVAFYYGGGAVGSQLPGYVYRQQGWSGFIALLAVVATVALALAASLMQRTRTGSRTGS